jgi:hypothetical protein
MWTKKIVKGSTEGSEQTRELTWNSGNNITKFEFVKDGCFACSIKTHHQNANLASRREGFEEFCKPISHNKMS